MQKVVSAIIFYQKNFLILYDQNFSYCVLVQGHVESGESMREALSREIREETGFTNIKIIKQIGRHQYHYQKEGSAIYKKIVIYLVELISLENIRPKMLKHELFSNKLLTFEQALTKLVHTPDKKYLQIANSLIK